MKLILVRHSISNHNLNDIISGAQSNPDLSEAGVRKAAAVFPKLRLNRIDQVYASPLKRAFQTAEILTNHKKDIFTDQRLLEMNFGSWEGQHATPLYEQYPDAFDFVGLIGDNYLKYAENAESYQDVIDRVRSFYEEIKVKHSNQTVMVVCHGFTIRAFMAALLNVKIEKIGAVNNVSFTEFNIDAEHDYVQLMSFNQDLPIYYGI